MPELDPVINAVLPVSRMGFLLYWAGANIPETVKKLKSKAVKTRGRDSSECRRATMRRNAPDAARPIAEPRDQVKIRVLTY